MNITIDLDSETPLFEQLVHEVKQRVKAGQLNAGDSLPSIRQLAGDLQLNNKTVAKAYRLLERDRVIVARGYRGTFIHDEALANCDTDLKSEIDEVLRDAIVRLHEAGATDSEIRNAFTELMKGMPQKGDNP
ncbi:MAG: GntR family transcriptional regulator [Pseudohongiellaceae bacterium]